MSQMITALPHLDSAETIFFLRELEAILTTQFDVKYATLKAKQLIPIRTDMDPGAETFTYSVFNYSGVAKRVTADSGNFPNANASGVQVTNPVASYGAAFSYSIDELRAAQKAGRSLDRMRAFAARRMIDQKVDQVLATGDSDVDNGSQSGTTAPMAGLLSASTQTAADQYQTQSVSGSTLFANKTADQIIADVNGALAQVPQNTKDVEHPKRFVFPVAQYLHLKQTPRSTISDTSILKFLEDANPGVEFTSWYRLTGAATGANAQGQSTSGGTFSSNDIALAYDPTPMNLFSMIPIEFEQMAPQLENMLYKVNCRCKMSGLAIPYPKSLIFLPGI